MQEYRVYDPADFGMYGCPADDEAYAIFEKLDRFGKPMGKAVLTYIGSDDFVDPPSIDLDAMEEMDFDPGNIQPVFSHISVRKDGTIVLDDSNDEINLSSKQNELLSAPYCICTLDAKYETDYNAGGATCFYKDRTLDGMKAVKLNGRECVRAINEKYPALLEPTHTRYGHTPPYYPFAKYYEGRDKMVVFIAKSQIPKIEDDVINGEIPYYKDYFQGDSWDSNNTYGICIIDDTSDKYNIRLVKPEVLGLIKEEMKEKEKLKNEHNKETSR